MGFWKSGKNNDSKHNDIFADDDDFLMPASDNHFGTFYQKHTNAPHALTADEVSASKDQQAVATAPKPASVYEQMKKNEAAREQAADDDYKPSWASVVASKTEKTEKNETATRAHGFGEEDIISGTKPTESKPTESKPTESKPAEVKPAEAKPVESKPAENKPTAVPTAAETAAEKLKITAKPTERPVEKPEAKAEAQKPSENETMSNEFLQRCREAIDKKSEKPTEEIIPEKPKSDEVDLEEIMRKLRGEIEKDTGKTAGAVSKPTDIYSDSAVNEQPAKKESKPEPEKIEMRQSEDETAKKPEEIKMTPAPEAPKAEKFPTSAINFAPYNENDIRNGYVAERTAKASEKEIEIPANEPEEKALEVEVIPSDRPAEIMHTLSFTAPVEVPEDKKDDKKVFGKVVRGNLLAMTADGKEVDMANLVAEESKAAADEAKTVMFGNLAAKLSESADRSFDDDDEDIRVAEEKDYDKENDEEEDTAPYYEREDEALNGIRDYKTVNDSVRVRTELNVKISKSTVAAVFSAIATALLCVFSSGLFDTLDSKVKGITDLIVFAVALLFNIEVFGGMGELFRGRPNFNACIALNSVIAIIQTVVCSFVKVGEAPNMLAVAALILTAGSIARAVKNKRILTGLEKIATSETKRAVIGVEGDRADTIASGAVDGEALVLYGRPAVNITDYIKNSNYLSPFDLKCKAIFFTGLLLSAAVGVAVSLLKGAAVGLTLASVVSALTFSACAAFSAELPMYFISKRTSALGGAIAGYKGIYSLNLANVVAVNTSDLFPEGTVKLYNMRPLGQSDMGGAIVDAAAVAIAAGSPLAQIFRGMLDNLSENDLPKVDGVRFEDKMGVYGWMGEKTVLIGNRNLLQAHNIEAPSNDVDQKILRSGYFPVYIAIDGAPVVLFIVKYEADENIAAEMQRLCATGMTVVVNPEDPNCTDMMLADYFEVSQESVKVMNHNGIAAYQKRMSEKDSVSAPAAFGKNISGFFYAVTSAVGLKSKIGLMTAVYIISAVLGFAAFGYMYFIGGRLLGALAATVYEAAVMLISIIIAKLKS